MINNFDNEIMVLDNSKYISDKSRIFYVYTEFYKEIITALSFRYNSLIPEFKKYLTITFRQIVEKIEIDLQNTDYLVFLNHFFNRISNNEFILKSGCLHISSVIETYLSKFDSIKDSYRMEIPYVDILDTISMNFYTKARVMLILIEHFNNFTYNFNSLYRTEISTPRVMRETVDKVVSLIPEIMSKSDGFDSFTINLQKKTYDILSDIVSPDKPPFRYFSDRRMNDVVNNLSDYEKEIFWSLILSCLSGYEKEMDDNKNSFDKMKYNVKKLSVSKKLNNLGYKVC